MKFISVVSGKGGVGKSTFSSILAAKLSLTKQVLFLDFDLTGPSNVFNIDGKVIRTKHGLKPISVSNNLHVLSMALLVNKESAVIWRTPKKLQLLEMFYSSAFEPLNENGTCGEHKYDFVIIDTPPGLTVVHQFLKEKRIKPLLITTSQNIALSDSINTIYFFSDKNEDQEDDFSGINDHFYGIVENMDGIRCTNCDKINNIFSRNGGLMLAKKFNIKFFGSIEIDKTLAQKIENGNLLQNINDLCCNDLINSVITDIG